MGTVELEPDVRGWLEELPAVQFATAGYFDLLAGEGPLLGEPYTRQLTASSGSCGSIRTVRRCASPIGSRPVGGSCC